MTKKSIGQCSFDAWNISNWSLYSSGDIVSNDNKDYQAISGGYYQYEPSGSAGSLGWTLLSDPCTGKTTPTLDATQVRGNYCTTSFGVGKITNNGDATITARGFVFGLTTDPNLNDDAVLIDAGTGTGDEFEGLLDNLTPETTYYIKSYATNSEGTAYGTETSFTTMATADCEPNCLLACDMTDASLLDPTWSGSIVISVDDTVCITQDVNISAGVTVEGMLKVCNGAQINLSGSITVQRGSLSGQIVYEGCDEIFDGVGSYSSSHTDPAQMISYCGTCVNNDTSQFLELVSDPYQWAATCRPTSTLLNPLPVELTKFTVQSYKNGALLSWTTNSEINNSHFEIETSYDGINWENIGIVQGAGNSFEINNYQFIDNKIGSGIQYYRLKQLDFDGTEAHSNIRHLSFDNKTKPTSFIAFQNQNNKIEVQAKFNGMGEAFLIDTRGKIIANTSFISTDKTGLNLEFSTNNLAEGVYFVKIKSGNALLGQKVQVLK
jgi:hypothetical protein